MSLPLSRELGSVLHQARDISRKTSTSMSSAHLLLALFTVPNRAAVFLKDKEITVDKLLNAMSSYTDESPEIIEKINKRSARIAQGSNADTVTSLHLLAALTGEKLSHAWQLLEECGTNIGSIRVSVMSYATQSRPLPRRFQVWDNEESSPVVEVEEKFGSHNEFSPRPIDFHPMLDVNNPHRLTSASALHHGDAEPERSSPAHEDARPMSPDYESSSAPSRKPSPAPPPVKPGGSGTEADSTTEDETHARKQEAIDEARKTARQLARNLFAKRKQAEQRLKSAPNLDRNEAAEAQEPDAPTQTGTPESEEQKSCPSLEGTPALEQVTDAKLAQQYQLDEDDYPLLTRFGRNLTAEAALGNIDRVIGRDDEIMQLIDILGKRRSNNPLLVGEAGVGKTAIVEGLSCQFVDMARAGNKLGKRAIIELEIGRLLSGTHLRGSLSERLIGLKDEVKQAGGQVIVFLDEIHVWMSANAGGDGGDAAGELKTALARGQFPCIGATTHDEFRKFIEPDPALERRFQLVMVEEPCIDTSLSILKGIQAHYEYHHGVQFDEDAIEAAVRLSHRYIHDRQLPDKAISVVDLAGSRAARTKQTHVNRELVAHVIAESAGIPADRLTKQDRERFLQMEEFLSARIVGHDHVVTTIADVIRRNYAGFRSQRPIGSFLFLGPTGIGKTEMVKVLADFLFHDRDALVRCDMSEYMEAHSVSRLIGSPPGYVGHDQGGQLTEAIRRRPYQVVLLDEIEKAHPDVLNLLLQLFDEGHLTDSRGRHVDFSNTLVIMTSNLGSKVFDELTPLAKRARIGFADFLNSDTDPVNHNQELSDKVLSSAREHFTPELWNRIDERLVFMPLSRDEIAQIARLQLQDTHRRLLDESKISLLFDDNVVEHLVAHGGFDPKLGARPMRQTVQRLVENAVARLILENSVRPGHTVRIILESGEIVCTPDSHSEDADVPLENIH